MKNDPFDTAQGHPGQSRTDENEKFKIKVLEVVKKIPAGKTLSYKDVAHLAGSQNAYRAVGNILNKNYNLEIPCHRVVKSDGEIGGYNRGSGAKEKLLKAEGYL